MEKTEFEIRESVKEHLDVLRLNRGYQCLIRGGVLHRKQDGRYRLKIGQVDLHLDDDALPIDFESAYRLLGLDKRDALEAHTRKEAEFEARMNLMDAKQEKYMDLYRAERGKLAKLIEALEEINNVPTKMQESIDIYKESGYQLKTDSELVEKIAEFGFGELEFHTADIERLVTQSGIAFNALEAYKEGKKDEN